MKTIMVYVMSVINLAVIFGGGFYAVEYLRAANDVEPVIGLGILVGIGLFVLISYKALKE